MICRRHQHHNYKIKGRRLRVFENRVLRRIFELKQAEVI
jgi:hypothetical protein